MKKYVVLTAIVIVLLMVDNCVVPFIGINGYFPSFLFVFALSYSIVNGDWSCLWIGIATGFLQDINFFNGFGVNLFTNVLICYLAGNVGKSLFKEKIFMPTVSIFALALLKGILLFVILYFCKELIDYKTILYNSLYDFVISIFIYKFVYKLCQKDYMVKQWKF